jgi:hypothetical protein
MEETTAAITWSTEGTSGVHETLAMGNHEMTEMTRSGKSRSPPSHNIQQPSEFEDARVVDLVVSSMLLLQ